MRYPYLKQNIVYKEGPSAFGIYDLNRGKFYRVNKSAGSLLQSLNGEKEMHEFSDQQKTFIMTAAKEGLIEFQNANHKKDQTPLSCVIKQYRPVEFAWIEITSKCHQKCLHCFLGNDLNQYKHQPLHKIEAYVAALVKAGAKQIVLSGGEPMVHPNFEEIIIYLSQVPVKTSLLTTGTFAKSEQYKNLLIKHKTTVKIPLLGWGQNHDMMTSFKGGFEKVIHTIHSYKHAGVKMELGTTVTSLNIDDIPKIRHFANTMKIPLEVSPIYQIGQAKINKDILVKNYHKILEICKEDKKPVLNFKTESKNPKNSKLKKSSSDYAAVNLKDYLVDQWECGQKIIAILANGLVTPCILLRDSKFALGSTESHDLNQILSSEFSGRKQFHKTMSLQNVPDCRDCEARYVCKAGGCPATSYAIHQTIYKKNPFYSKCYYENPKTRSEVGIASMPA